MSEKKELKPTDTAKLLEWLEEKRSHYSDETERYEELEAHAASAEASIIFNVYDHITSQVRNKGFAIAETPSAPSAPDPLQVLAEIWDKHAEALTSGGHTGIYYQGKGIIDEVTAEMFSTIHRHSLAVKLALAVHLEIDGTVGSHKRTKRLDLAFDTRSGQLLLSVGSSTSPCYLRYSNMADAQRACELLQPIAKELFFVFEDATPEKVES